MQECLSRGLGIENAGPPETEGYVSPAKRAKTFRGLKMAAVAAYPRAACHGWAAATPARREPPGQASHEHLNQQQPEAQKTAPGPNAADCGSPRHAGVSALSLNCPALVLQSCLSTGHMLHAMQSHRGTEKSNAVQKICKLMQEGGDTVSMPMQESSPAEEDYHLLLRSCTAINTHLSGASLPLGALQPGDSAYTALWQHQSWDEPGSWLM